MSFKITLQTAETCDTDTLGQIMFDGVHEGNSLYTQAEKQAWMPKPRSGETWKARLAGQAIFVAYDANTPVGFMTLKPGGYVDFAYVRGDRQGQGLFRQLFNALTDHALAQGETHLSTHASLMAQPAFAACGFTIESHDIVEQNGEQLRRAAMRKPL